MIEAAVVTDATYLPWTATAMVSWARASGWDLRVHVLHSSDIGPDDLRKLAALGESQRIAVRLCRIDEAALEDLPPKDAAHGGRISWARVLLPDLLPDLARVLYLDADTFAVDSLRPLWQTELGDAAVGAVANVTEDVMRAHVRALGLDGTAGYFNAGVLVVDLARWREEGATAALRTYATTAASLPWFDQDALNVVFAGRWHALHPRWNAMTSLWIWPDLAADVFGDRQVSEATSDPGVLHFEGPSISKPWHYLCDHPWRHAYREIHASTAWAGVPLEDRTAATQVIARLPKGLRVPAYRRLHRARTWLVRERSR